MPISEAELHAFVDSLLPAERQRVVADYLALYPEEAQRVQAYRAQRQELRAQYDKVLSEPPPRRVLAAAAAPRIRLRRWPLALGALAIALASGMLGWGARGAMMASSALQTNSPAPQQALYAQLVQRAAVAHGVYSPDQRRPVEVDAAHEDQLIAWLSKRMGAKMQAPHLQAQGYALEGGRLLPGERGPVSQFMYRNELGNKLTLYVSRELPVEQGAQGPTVSFRFAQQGKLNMFYWVEGDWGYALSAEADRAVLEKISSEVYQQLSSGN